MKVDMFVTQKSAMPLSFSNFDFLLIYKADSAGSRTYPFAPQVQKYTRGANCAHEYSFRKDSRKFKCQP